MESGETRPSIERGQFVVLRVSPSDVEARIQALVARGEIGAAALSEAVEEVRRVLSSVIGDELTVMSPPTQVAQEYSILVANLLDEIARLLDQEYERAYRGEWSDLVKALEKTYALYVAVTRAAIEILNALSLNLPPPIASPLGRAATIGTVIERVG